MKKVDLVFACITVPLDWCMVMAAGIAAYFVRFQTLAEMRPIIFQMPFGRFVVMMAIIATSMVAIFALSGLYTVRARKIQNEIQRIITSCSTGMMLVIAGIFFLQEYFSSRFVILLVWVLVIVFISSSRGILRLVRRLCFRAGLGVIHVALIGVDERVREFQAYVASHPYEGIQVVTAASNWNDDFKKRLTELIHLRMLDELIVIQQDSDRTSLADILDFSLLHHLEARYAADTYGLKRFFISHFAGIPFIVVNRTRLRGWMRILKRIFDFILSLLMITFFSPLMALIAILIKLQSKGPIIYKDIRVGQRGTFITYKFRTMFLEYCTGVLYDKTGQAEVLEKKLWHSHNERQGPVPKVLHDPRRTPIGRFLEATSLDELPQFFNVAIGTMSLVGPRPHRPKEVAGYDISHHQLFSVKPGLTGLAQISGRSDLHFDEEVSLDLFYIENWSPWLDFVILIKTPLSVLMRKSRG